MATLFTSVLMYVFRETRSHHLIRLRHRRDRKATMELSRHIQYLDSRVLCSGVISPAIDIVDALPAKVPSVHRTAVVGQQTTYVLAVLPIKVADLSTLSGSIYWRTVAGDTSVPQFVRAGPRKVNVLGTFSFPLPGRYGVEIHIDDSSYTVPKSAFPEDNAPSADLTSPVTVKPDVSVQATPIAATVATPISPVLNQFSPGLFTGETDAKFKAKINWGDHVITAGTIAFDESDPSPYNSVDDITGTHTYTKPGTYRVVETLTGSHGLHILLFSTVEVSAAAN